jgi:hypothetical protein
VKEKMVAALATAPHPDGSTQALADPLTQKQPEPGSAVAAATSRHRPVRTVETGLGISASGMPGSGVFHFKQNLRHARSLQPRHPNDHVAR